MTFNSAKAATAVSMTAILGMLAACSPPHIHHHDEGPLKTVSTLDCPTSQDDLKLVSGASGAGPCVYTDDDGDKVTLQLVSLTGTDSTAALAPFRTAAEAELPAIKPAGGGATASSSTSSGSEDKVDLDLPGIHIHTNGDGHAQVNAMGVHVDADDHDSHHAVVTVPGGGGGHDMVTVNANDGGARIEVHEKGSGVRSMFMLASDNPGPHGWKSVGFEAMGPEGGPIVVASILSKGDHNQSLRDEAKDLVKHNVGG
jgi:hypothetical protein